MSLTPALRTHLSKRPKKPFRGLSASLVAGLLNHPRVLQPLFQYVLPLFQGLLDLSPYFIVTTHRDVREVMERDDDFAIGPMVGPAMVCGTFVLGSDRTPLYREDLAVLWHAFYGVTGGKQMPPGGPNPIAQPPSMKDLLNWVSAEVEKIVAKAERGTSRIDLVKDILRPVCAGVVQRHMGIGPPLCPEWIDLLWQILASLALRIILPGTTNPMETNNPVLNDLNWSAKMLTIAIHERIAEAAAAKAANAPVADDIISQMYNVLAQRPPNPNAEPIESMITRNLAGLAITGCHPIAKAAAQAIDVLLDNPKALRAASEAALNGDRDLFWDFIDEALRFFPPFPLVTRACARDTTIATDSGTPRKVRAGQTVTLGLLPAMFDRDSIPLPYQFRTDRAPLDSLVFGRGVHGCFGYQFARDVLIALLMPLFACGFRRAPGRAGKLRFDVVVPESLELRLAP